MCKVRSILELGKWEIGKFAVSVTSWTEGDFPPGLAGTKISQ
jgi:hypothetical protein